ncbi:hypothetical protein TNCV_2656541 [Trichonephila clavipes]|nr:hypothetical protein TNCV_2656541 [Trichonephila clavipes]
MSRNVPDKVILVESSPEEKMELSFIPPALQKSTDLKGKGMMVCGSVMLGRGTPLYVFDADNINSQRYRDENLEAYNRGEQDQWDIKCFGYIDLPLTFFY